jgi:hypothetical protein
MGCGFENLVLGGCFLELQLEPLVLGRDGVGVFFEGGEFGFEVFYVAFFAFAEGTLAGSC